MTHCTAFTGSAAISPGLVAKRSGPARRKSRHVAVASCRRRQAMLLPMHQKIYLNHLGHHDRRFERWRQLNSPSTYTLAPRIATDVHGVDQQAGRDTDIVLSSIIGVAGLCWAYCSAGADRRAKFKNWLAGSLSAVADQSRLFLGCDGGQASQRQGAVAGSRDQQ